MNYSIQKLDLFKVDFNEYIPAHCISADCKMGAGIAVPMKKRFKLQGMEKEVDPMILFPGATIYYNNVYNLITKKKYWHKPTYDTMTSSLVSMYYHATENGINKIVMPKIGSGLDKLQWSKVENIIKDVFKDSNIEILVCYI